MRLMFLVRFLQALALLGLVTGLAQGVVDAIFDPQNGFRPVFASPPTSGRQRAEQLIDPVSRTVWLLLGPGMLFVLCEIAVILDRRLPTHPDTEP